MEATSATFCIPIAICSIAEALSSAITVWLCAPRSTSLIAPAICFERFVTPFTSPIKSHAASFTAVASRLTLAIISRILSVMRSNARAIVPISSIRFKYFSGISCVKSPSDKPSLMRSTCRSGLLTEREMANEMHSPSIETMIVVTMKFVLSLESPENISSSNAITPIFQPLSRV